MSQLSCWWRRNFCAHDHHIAEAEAWDGVGCKDLADTERERAKRAVQQCGNCNSHREALQGEKEVN